VTEVPGRNVSPAVLVGVPDATLFVRTYTKSKLPAVCVWAFEAIDVTDPTLLPCALLTCVGTAMAYRRPPGVRCVAPLTALEIIIGNARISDRKSSLPPPPPPLPLPPNDFPSPLKAKSSLPAE
jgi:hypothetical protein